jgi:DNA-binding GntR family transcriptional regulator
MLESAYAESKLRPDEALEEHRAIYAALASRDVGLAKRLVEEHARQNEELLVKALAQPDPG